jgi:hypothetical protein
MESETYNLLLFLFMLIGAFALGLYCGKND